jgi:hypothetical protein
LKGLYASAIGAEAKPPTTAKHNQFKNFTFLIIMKYNRIFLGLGVMALAIATSSCSDDVEYTPADPVTAPPAYFSMTNETEFDLEETDTEFTVNLYRANSQGELTVPVTTTLTAEDGSTVASNIFTYPSTVTFADGSNTATYKVTFSIPDLTELLTYKFALSVEGENSPYYVTAQTVSACYTPWTNVEDCTWIDNTLDTVFASCEEETWEIEVQEHPTKKGFFRIVAPYSTGSYSDMYDFDREYSTTDYPLDPLPHYLYINATSANEVYFSDSKGNPTIFYNTGMAIGDYGYYYLFCGYSTVLNDTTLDVFGKSYLSSNFEGDAGVMTTNSEGKRKIKFEKLGSFLSEYTEGFFYPQSVEIWLDGANDDDDWTLLGEGEWTDGFLSQMFFDVAPTPYKVQVYQSATTAGVYRVKNPYAAGTWQYGAADWDKTYDIEIDASAANNVKISNQIAYEDADGSISIANASYIYTSGKVNTTLTDDEIIAQGLNDVLENGVLTINNPVVIQDGSAYYVNTYLANNGVTFIPGKLVLPTTTEAATTSAKKAAKVAGSHKANLSNAKIKASAIAKNFRK